MGFLSERRIAATALLILSVALGGVAAVTPGLTSPAAAVTACRPTDFTPQIRAVKGTASIQVYRFKSQSFGVGVTIVRGQRTTTSKTTTLYARVGSQSSVDTGASATLKKVVGIFVKLHAQLNLAASYRTTSTETTTVTSQVTMHVPAGTTLIWYRARRYVNGTYEQSVCKSDGPTSFGGTVVWRTHTWSSYVTEAAGGTWTCRLKAQTPFELAAQRKARCFA
ncbi:hypothetical protein GCM10028801_20540 [Nocardioides maradonensis]